MENQKQKVGKFKDFSSFFFNAFPSFSFPLPLFLFVPLGVRLYYILMLFWFWKCRFLLFIWVFLATTLYIIRPDRIEIKTGIFVKRSRSIPFDKIINITCKQNIAQKLFRIGDIFIETPGGKPFELALAGVERP